MSFYYESLPIEKIYYGDDPINMVYCGSDLLFIRDVTLEIVPYPSDATVTLTATGYTQVDNSITVKYGTSVSYTVSKSGHETKSGTIIVTDDQQVPITLLNQVVLTIEPTPSNATVVLTADGFTQVGNSIVVNPGTSVSYSISRTGYITQTDTIIVNTTQTLQISLTHEPCTLTINPTPSDAIVIFDTGIVSGNSCLVPYGSSVTYTVSKQYYTSQTQTINITSDQTINVTLTTPYYFPAVGENIVNLNGAAKHDNDTKFIPGRYEVDIAAGGMYALWSNGYNASSAGGKITQTITVTEPFIVRAYSGSRGTCDLNNATIGTNPYSGPFKINGMSVNGTPSTVTHVFGNAGSVAMCSSGVWCVSSGNSLGNGAMITGISSGAGSCLHLVPIGGTFGTNYLFAFHTTSGVPNSFMGGIGSAYGGASSGSSVSFFGESTLSTSAGGSTPYGNGGAGVYNSVGASGTGIGCGKINNGHGVAAWFNGSTWQNSDLIGTNGADGYIRITYLGQ